MKIGLVYDAVYPYIKGGGERRYFEMAKRLAKRGHDIHLYGQRYWSGSSVYRSEGVTVHGICPAVWLYNEKGRRSISEAIYFGLACLLLLKEDLDLIDCANFPFFPLFALRLVTWIRRKPLVATWHEVWGRRYWVGYLGNLGYLGYVTEIFASRMPDFIIANSAHTARRLRTVLGVKSAIRVVSNGIDYPTILRTKPAEETSDVIFVGRLLDYKHVDILLQAITRLKQKFPKIVCTIVGDGPEKRNLQSLVERLKIRDNVQFTGFLTDPARVYALMKSSKVFVLPSIREGFGIVAVEANACGLPVVTVDHPENGAKDLITAGKNGWIVPPREEEITQVVLSYLRHTARQAALKNQSRIFARSYDWEVRVHQLISIYKNLAIDDFSRENDYRQT